MENNLSAMKKALEEGLSVTFDFRRQEDGDLAVEVRAERDTCPDFQSMEEMELLRMEELLEDKLSQLDVTEPEDEESEVHKQWEELHDELEEMLDEVQDCLDECK